MKDACVLMNENGQYIIFGYEHIEAINTSVNMIKLSTYDEVIEFKELYITNEQDLYMSIVEAMALIEELKEG